MSAEPLFRPRELIAEALGTALLVTVGVGAATESFGFKLAGISPAAGVVLTALAFGLVLLAIVQVLGPISGAHVNPAVTLGFVVSGRMKIQKAVAYWIAQGVGGCVGALLLWGVVSGASGYSRTKTGLGADGWGPHVSMLGIGASGAFITEVVLTFAFVLVVLIATSRVGSPGFAASAIGIALVAVHLVGIPLTGTSVNPARSLGPALIVGHTALSQLWLFIVAPLVGGLLSALAYRFLVPTVELPTTSPSAVTEGPVLRTTATP